jgi:hypothetical protein
VLALTPIPTAIAGKVASLIRLLASTNECEVIATVHALERTLKSANSDLHALAAQVEKPNGNGLPEAEMKKIYNAGYHDGVQAAENRHHGVHDFLNADGKPNWDAVALFLQHNKDRLDPKHHQFIDDMASRTVYGREPTEKQHKYLHSLFFKLGGKIK